MSTLAARILFVCSGNTCRSPLAEWLCAARWPRRVETRSAGTVRGESLAAEVLPVLGELGVEAESSVPIDVAKVDLGSFDTIVALDGYVARDLLLGHALSDVKERFLEWAISDPYGKGLDAYRRCASEISKQLEVHRDQLLLGHGGANRPTQAVPALEDRLGRWLAELDGAANDLAVSPFCPDTLAGG